MFNRGTGLRFPASDKSHPPALAGTWCGPSHCVRRDLLWPPLLPGFSSLVQIQLPRRVQHTLIVHKRGRQIAASIVAPLRKTKPELSAHLLLISFRSYCIKNQLRRREWSKKRERASFLCIWVVLSLGVLTSGSAQRIIIHSALWQARVWLIDSRSGKKPWDLRVLFKGLFSYCCGKEDFARSLSLSRRKESGGAIAERAWLNLWWRTGFIARVKEAFGFLGKTHPTVGICVFISYSPWPRRGFIFYSRKTRECGGRWRRGYVSRKLSSTPYVVECSWKYWNVADDSLAVKRFPSLPSSPVLFSLLRFELYQIALCHACLFL